MSYVVDAENLEEYTFDLPNNEKKVVKYFSPEGFLEPKLEADFMTISIYDSEGKLISEETKKNPERDKRYF